VYALRGIGLMLCRRVSVGMRINQRPGPRQELNLRTQRQHFFCSWEIVFFFFALRTMLDVIQDFLSKDLAPFLTALASPLITPPLRYSIPVASSPPGYLRQKSQTATPGREDPSSQASPLVPHT